MTEFTSEWIEEQLDKWHNSTPEEWQTECWNNYGLALEHLQRVVSDLHMHELWHTHYKDECVELKQRIAELEQERRWIPVSERLPEVGEIVSWSHPSWKRTKEGYMTGSGRLKVWGGEYLKIDKLKWQPLPQPPKEGE